MCNRRGKKGVYLKRMLLVVLLDSWPCVHPLVANTTEAGKSSMSTACAYAAKLRDLGRAGAVNRMPGAEAEAAPVSPLIRPADSVGGSGRPACTRRAPANASRCRPTAMWHISAVIGLQASSLAEERRRTGDCCH